MTKKHRPLIETFAHEPGSRVHCFLHGNDMGIFGLREGYRGRRGDQVIVSFQTLVVMAALKNRAFLVVEQHVGADAHKAWTLPMAAFNHHAPLTRACDDFSRLTGFTANRRQLLPESILLSPVLSDTPIRIALMWDCEETENADTAERRRFTRWLSSAAYRTPTDGYLRDAVSLAAIRIVEDWCRQDLGAASVT